LRRLSTYIGKANRRLGEILAWLTGSMVLVTFVIVVLRYVFDSGWIWLQETVTWMHALVFMLAAAYTLGKDEHVRVDVVYRGMDQRKKTLVNLLGALLLLGPTCVFLIIVSWDYVSASWAIHEGSREAGGLPGLFLLKSIIPITSILLLLQGLSRSIDEFLVARGHAAQPESPGPQTQRDTGL